MQSSRLVPLPTRGSRDNWNAMNRAYTVAEIVTDGSFLSAEELRIILVRWEKKKNLVLQGPPGTGKIWSAKRQDMPRGITSPGNYPFTDSRRPVSSFSRV